MDECSEARRWGDIVTPEYRDLYFGKSDSRNEANESQNDFVKSYVDLNGTSRSVVCGEKFLVLGPKGTGKSALAWYLKATEGADRHLALVRDASSLPLAEIPRIQTGQSAGPERTVVAWKFILLCNYLELLLRDQGCSLQNDSEVTRVSKLLRDYGFMGDAAGRALLKASSTTITIPIPKLGQIYRRESRTNLNLYNLIPYLESWVVDASSRTRHVLLLDGLDSIFLNDPSYDESLSALVQAAYGLNQRLQSRPSTGSIVLLLRNDIFSRMALSLPDSQKMRDDLSLDLDWRVLSGSAGVRAPLIQLVNAKAARASGIEYIEVLEYFPPNIELNARDPASRRMPRLQYLLNLTRHTPRDLLRLFEEIRNTEAMGIYSRSVGGSLSQEVIREGVLQYSTKYFVGAIRNEFAGFEGGPESAAAAITALQHIGKQRFDREEFCAALSEARTIDHDKAESPDRLLTLLFYAGAIGNYVSRRGETYMQFYHRRDDSEVYLRGQFVLHNALIHAWGLHRG
ncbi:hypothetical protein ABN034_07675 [Actinopolymorpha sp. B11F2]|uniref:P-loop ATPase, Sll1717 family n=1 Tax=Actinopolymorpha sp. B11F2 TaxID=3160862 RepID=UPI0032E44490